MLRLRTALAILAVGACTSTGGLSSGGAEPDAAAPPAEDSGVPPPADAGAGGDADAGFSSRYRAEVLADAPLAYYRLGEKLGAAALDEADAGAPAATYFDVLHGRPGALSGDPNEAVELVTGRIFVDHPRVGFSGTAPFTLEAWLLPKQIDGEYRRIFSHERTAPREGYLVYITSNDVGFNRFLDGGPDVAQYAGTLALGRFTYVVATYDGNEMRLYLDAALVASSTAPASRALAPIDTPFTVGANSQFGQESFVGIVDEVAIYDKALPPVRVVAHYQAGTGK